MLNNFRHSSTANFLQASLLLISLVMVATPIISAFSPTGENPTLLQSPNHKVTLKDLFARDHSLLQTLYKIQAQPHTDLAQKAISQYYRSFSYQDFFNNYGCALDDSVAWSWFLKQFNVEMTQEQYTALEQSVLQQFGSKKRFLEHVKPQLLAQKIQTTLAAVIAPIEGTNNVVTAPLTHSFQQYTFSPRDYVAKAIASDPQELIEYFTENQNHYMVPASMDVQALFVQPYSIDLSQISSQKITQAKTKLQALGYAEIDDVLLQQQIFSDISMDLQQRKIFTIDEVLLLYPALKDCVRESLKNVSAQALEDSFSSPGLFPLLQSQFEDRYTSALLPLQPIPLESGLWLVAPSHYVAAHVPTYAQVSHHVLQDWTDMTAGRLAQKAAQDFIDSYKNGQPVLERPSAEYVTEDLLQDGRFPDRVKIQLAQLVAADIDLAQSITAYTDGQADSGVKVYTLSSVSFTHQPENADSKETESITPFDLSRHAHQTAVLQAFDRSIDKSFGYEVRPEFWAVLARFQSQQESIDSASA